MSPAKIAEDDCRVKMTAAPPSLDGPDLRSRAPQPQLPPTDPPRDEDATRAAAAERWKAGAAARARERRSARRGATLGERLDAAVLALRTASTVGAAPLGRSSRSAVSDGDPGPPKPHTPMIDANLKIVEYQVEQIEAALDAERGYVVARSPLGMTCEEKDREIWKLAGLTHDQARRRG